MINMFPLFSPLSIRHQSEVKAHTARFDPYSDFNFTSLYAWNTTGETAISSLNDNLIIKLPDYLTGQVVYSLLGDHKIDQSLLQLSSLTNDLKLVPEVVIKSIRDSKLITYEEDNDNFDYVFSLSDLANLKGARFRSKRKSVNRFLREEGGNFSIKETDYNDRVTKDRIMAIFDKWAQERQKEASEASQESSALENLLLNASHFNLIGFELLLANNIIGFSINEVVDNNYAFCHFQKTLLSHNPNADVFLSNQTAIRMQQHDCIYVNWEQDLGIPGLKILKESYKPEKFLKKYKVSVGH